MVRYILFVGLLLHILHLTGEAGVNPAQYRYGDPFFVKATKGEKSEYHQWQC